MMLLVLAGFGMTSLDADAASQDVVIANKTYVSGQVETVVAAATVTAGTAVTVQSSAGVTYVAGTRITLSPGFHASSGATFHAYVGDADADGMPDAWEIAMFGSTSASPTGNADGDSLDNLTEFLLGTDPNVVTPPNVPTTAVVIHRPTP